MEISNFSSLIELSATLNIAFVAVEYVKSYTDLVCNNIFKINSHIQEKFDNSKNNAVDEKTIDNLNPIDVNGKSTLFKIEEIKRKREKYLSDVEEERNRISKGVADICATRSMSSLSLTAFFFSFFALLLSAFHVQHPEEVRLIWSMYTMGITLFMVVGWIIGEKYKFKYLDYTQLRHAIIYSIVLFLGSCGIVYILSENNHINFHFTYDLWNLFLIISIILMFFNFIVFVMKIWYRGKKIISTIDKQCKMFEDRNSKIQQDIDNLLRVKQLSEELDLGFIEDDKPENKN